MGHIRGKGHHRTTASHSPVRALVVVLVIVAVLVGGGWLVVRHMQAAAPVAKPDKAATVTRVDLDNKQAVPEPVVEHHGNSPDCPDTDCISMLVNGDLLFHPNLWKHFAGANTAATDGTAFDFTPLFETMKPYIQASDIAVCEFETPIAKRGGPYTGYPVFNVPPEVADAAASVGYTACTHATNHSWDQGADGIARLWDTLASKGIAQTGSYKNEEDSTKPLVIDSPTGGGKLSKRDGDKMGFPVFPLFWTSPTGETARGYREDGYFPEAFINMLALLGWNPGTEQELFSMQELIDNFSLERVSKSGARFQPDKAKWFNAQYMHHKSDAELAALFQPILRDHGIEVADEVAGRAAGIMKERATFITDLWDLTSFFFTAPAEYEEKQTRKYWKGQNPEILRELRGVLASIDDFSKENTEQIVHGWIEEKGYGMGQVMNTLRLALVGAGKGPGMYDVTAFIGREETLRRIDHILATLKPAE